MASLKDIRARIESTKNTQQITKAMKLVSAAKLRKAQNNIVNMRPYALTLRKVIADIAVTKKVSHPLMEKKEQVKNVLLVVISSDRGLCGAFNSNINKFTEAYYNENKSKLEKIDFLFVAVVHTTTLSDAISRRLITSRSLIKTFLMSWLLKLQTV